VAAAAESGNQDQGIDVDAVAAIMAATTEGSGKPRSEGSNSPSTVANKALSKALGKFHATAASFKTKLAQLSDVKDAQGPDFQQQQQYQHQQYQQQQYQQQQRYQQSKLETESSFVKPTVGEFGDNF